MEGNERKETQGEKMKHMGFDLWVNEHHLSLVM